MLQAAAKWAAARKVGVAKVASDVDAYLLPPCGLAERQLRTARKERPAARLPQRPADRELLLVIVHNKVRLGDRHLSSFMGQCASGRAVPLS